MAERERVSGIHTRWDAMDDLKRVYFVRTDWDESYFKRNK